MTMTAMMPFSANAMTQGWISFFRVLASNSGLAFVFGENQQPRTDGKTVYLPSLPVVLTPDDLDLVKAFGFHEVGHCQFSDVQYFHEFAVKHGDFARFLLNALDDVYMENKQARATREAEGYFRRKATILFERMQFRDGSSSAAEAVACYALCYLRKNHWIEFHEPLAVIEANFNRHFGEHADAVRTNLNDILINEFPSVNSTRDAGSLALRIISMFKALRDEDEQQTEKDSGGGQGAAGNPGDAGRQQQRDEQEDGNSSGSNSPGAKSEDTNGSASVSGESQPSGGDESGGGQHQMGSSHARGLPNPGVDGAGAAGTKLEHDGNDKAGGRSLSEIVDEILSATGLGDKEVFDDREAVGRVSKSVRAGTNPSYKGQSLAPCCVIEGSLDGVSSSEGSGKGGGAGNKSCVDGMSVCPADATEAREMAKRLGRKSQVLASKLQSLLMQQEEAELVHASRGQLGQSHLYRLSLGDTRLFTQSEEVTRPTTAVSIVVDLSSSTQDKEDQLYAAKEECQFTGSQPLSTLRSILESVVLLEKVFDQIGSPREILGFAPKGGELMTMVRTFGDNTQTAINRIGGLRRIAGGGHTPIGEAVFHAGRRLVSHEANRKVMFVLTDGAPGNERSATEMTRLCASGGVRVVYLVIGEKVRTDWLTLAGIPYAVAKTSSEVAPVLLAEAQKLLL